MNRQRSILLPILLTLLLVSPVLSGTASAQEIEVPAATGVPAPPDELSPPPDAQTTASGLAYQVLAEGDGSTSPDDNDLVLVDYTGWIAESGEVFDSSSTRGEPSLLPIEALIDGWTEGLQLMTEGAKYRMWIPGELAYQGIDGRPQGMLVFDVELHDVRSIPPVPENLAQAPSDATLTNSGLAWKRLEEGTGTTKPGPGNTVEVHYIGWNTEGQWFDATYAKGGAAELQFDQLIEGWQEALEMMVPGEKRRLWIPARLAYQGEPGKPQGNLVFDVHLLDVK